MADRRSAILEQARSLLSAHEGSFTMRELATESGVAIATLYNIFGSQDEIVNEAISDVFLNQVAPLSDLNEVPTIDHFEERIESMVGEIMRKPAFARRLIALYFDPEFNSAEAESEQKIPYEGLRHRLQLLKAADRLLPGIDPDVLAAEIQAIQYAIASRWAAGQISDGDLMWRIKLVVLTHMAGALAEPHNGPFREKLQHLNEENLIGLPTLNQIQ
jgi:AcrR family transcriptional regulator